MITPWIEPAVKNYLSYFNKQKNPCIAFRNVKPDDLVRVAHKIYNSETMWFESDVRMVQLPTTANPEIDVAYLDPIDLEQILIPKKTKMVVTSADADKNLLFNLGYQNVADEPDYQIWVRRGVRRG